MRRRMVWLFIPILTWLNVCGLAGWPVHSSFVQAQDKVDPAAVRQYNLAVALQKKKLYAQAAQKWATFIQAFPADPKQPVALHNLGICQWQDKKLAEAAGSFRTVLTKFPTFKSLDASQFQLAVVLQEMAVVSKKPEDFKTAAAAFADVPAKYATSSFAAPALYYQGECLYSAGDVAGCLAPYQKLITGFPAHELLPEAYYALGTAQDETGADANASASFQTFLQKFPQHKQVNECRLRLALSLIKQKKPAEAEPLLAQTAAVADFPYADFALLKQAQCVFERGQVPQGAPLIPQAAALYASLPTKFPKSAYHGAALLAAGKCFYQAAQFPNAQPVLTAAIALKGDDAAEAAYWLARTLIKLMKPADALAAADAAIAAYPMSKFLPQLSFARIDAIYEIPERRKETPPLYLALAQKFPDHELAPKAAYTAAFAATKLGDWPAAQANSAAFLANPKLAKHELVPEVLFLNAESHLLATPSDPAKAEPLYRRLIVEYPQHLHASQSKVRIGLCLYLAKKYADAIAFLNQNIAALKEPALVAESRLLIGRSHNDAGAQGPQAISAFQAALQTKPDWERTDEVLLALALSLRGEKMLAPAVAELNKLVTGHPKSLYRDQAYYQLGEIAYDEKKYDDAVTQYGQVIAQYPMSDLAPLAQNGITAAYFAKNDFAQSAAAATKLLATYPKSDMVPRATYIRGLSNQRLKQFDPALKDLAAYLATNPPERDALDTRYAIGLCQAGLKQYDAAVATWTALIAAKPDDPQADKAWYEMGFALLDAKKDKEAADAFRSLATKLPKSPLVSESWFRVGEFHENAKQLPEAILAYTAGLKSLPDQPAPAAIANAKLPDLREKLQYKLGWVQYQKELFPDAATTLLAQIKEHPQGKLLVDAQFLAAECLFRQNKFNEAAPLFAQVVQAKPEKHLPRALYRSGTCAANLQQWAASQAAYAALIQQFPKFELINEARYGLGFALQQQKKLDEAAATYLLITKDTNTETAAKSRFMIGEIAFSQKNYKDAIEHFLEVAVGYPYEEWQVLGYYEAGRCFIELKENGKARETLETVVTKFPKHPKAKEAATLIANLK